MQKRLASIKKSINSLKLQKLFSGVFAVLMAFLLSSVVVLISGGRPLETYGVMLKGAFGSANGISNTIRYTLPIILLGFSFYLCDLCGYFNIGQEGQMTFASLAIIFAGQLLEEQHSVIRLIGMLLFAIVFAGIFSIIPALLKLFLNINEIIISILLNYIVMLFSTYMLTYSRLGNPQATIPMSKEIVTALPEGVFLTIVIILVICFFLILKYTTFGYRLKMMGENTKFAKASGLPVVKIFIIIAFIGGALSGFASYGEIVGVQHKVYDGFVAGMGYNGMTAALLGSGSPLGIVIGATLLGAVQSGAVMLPILTDTPAELVLVIQGFIMFFSTVNLIARFKTKNKKGVK